MARVPKRKTIGSGEPATYWSKKLNLMWTVRQTRKKDINGEVVRIPGITVQFNNGFLVVRDPEIIKAIDGELNREDRDYSSAIQKMPSRAAMDKKVKQAQYVQKKVEEAAKEFVEKEGPVDPAVSDFDRFMEERQGKQPMILKQMRSPANEPG